LNLNKYKSIVFDCDGVVLNSNQVKTRAFYNAALSYGEGFASNLRDFHIQNGGISRYKKFRYFLTDIIGKKTNEEELNHLLSIFSIEVKKGLMDCEITKNLELLRKKTHKSKWLIVSGGDQEELREVFEARGIFKYFDGGIFGSPSCKDEILFSEIHNGNLVFPAIFIGDSKYDYAASVKAELDFVFLSGWSEVSDWQSWTSKERIKTVKMLDEL